VLTVIHILGSGAIARKNTNTLWILFDLCLYVNGEKQMKDVVECKTDLNSVEVPDEYGVVALSSVYFHKLMGTFMLS
jgi:hypothetical protein